MTPTTWLRPLQLLRRAALTRPDGQDRQAGGRPDSWCPTGIAPDAVVVGARALQVGDRWVRTLAVTGYPREVGPGWLEPLLAHPGRLDVALHIEPVPQPVAADRLRRQRARLESGRRLDANKDRLADPDLAVAADDAAELAERIARGQGRLFRVGLYLTVHADTQSALEQETTRVRGLLASLLFDAHPATFRSLQGWVSTLPLGVDALGMRRTMDTTALAAAFPFATADLPTPEQAGTDPAGTGLSAPDLSTAGRAGGGVLYGQALRGGALVCWDRFAQPNYNSVILARSGAGKSYLAKLEILRSLYGGVQVAVIDPEDEYGRLSHAVGGTHLQLGAGGVRLNPFDLDLPTDHDADHNAALTRAGNWIADPGRGLDRLTRRALFVHTLITVLLAEPLDPAGRAVLDAAILASYERVGITSDPRTHNRPAPLLTDLVAALTADNDPAARSLAARLTPYVTGSFRRLFDGPTSTRPDGHLVVFSLARLPDELKAAGTLLVIDAIWRQVSDPNRRRRRLVVVDEAWLLMRDPAGAAFLHRLAKSARKHWCGLTVISQDAADLLSTELGQAVVANAATHILLRQSPQAITAIGAAFGLSEGERAFLLAARTGEGLLAAGPDRVAFRAAASDTEAALITTDPAHLVAAQDHSG